MKTQVFTHKNYIGISSDLEAEGLVNNPANPGELGFVVDAEFVDIQPEALELLKKIPKSRDAIGDIDVFKASDDKVIFSWMGGPLNAFNIDEAEGSRDYDPSLLTANPDVKPDESFVKFIDEI